MLANFTLGCGKRFFGPIVWSSARAHAVGYESTLYDHVCDTRVLYTIVTFVDQDPILRWSGMYTVAMAYCGTANNAAIRRLLHVAVSDVNDDVRRAAVTSLGFLLFRLELHGFWCMQKGV